MSVVPMRSRTKHSDLGCRPALFHEGWREKDIQRAVFKELGSDITGNFWRHVVYIGFDDVYAVRFGMMVRRF